MPDWNTYVRAHLPILQVSPEREAEIAGELALQLDQAYADALAAGLSDDQATAAACKQIADWNCLAAAINDAERSAPLSKAAPGGLFTGIFHDVRQAFRFLRRSPLMASIAILTLAFGIGANTSVFTIVDAVALRSLPYEQPGRLMAIETHRVSQPELEPWTSALDFFDFRDRTRTFAKVAAVSPVWNLVLTGRGEAQRLETLFVSADFFPLLGVKPVLGRGFLSSEDNRAQASQVVILGHAFWQRQFGGNAEAVGQNIALDNGAYTIVGVLPRDFRYAGEPLAGTATDIDVWLPLASNPLVASQRGLRFLKVIGRLKPAVSTQQGNDEVHRIATQLAAEFPATNKGFSSDAMPLSNQIAGRSRTTFLMLLGAVGFVLLMACANVSHLLLARAVARQRDIAVRVALGASAFRLLRGLFVEGAVLACIGASVGVVLAIAGLRLLIATGPAAVIRTHDLRLDLRALLFTGAVAIISAIASGLPPAWHAARSQIGTALRQGGRGMTPGHHRLRAGLVVVQLAMASVLLAGAGLLIHSFVRLLDVNPGFNANNLVTISTQVPSSATKPEQRAAVYRRMRDELLSVPGVLKVAAVSRLPLLGSNLGSWLFVEGATIKGEQGADVEYRAATPDYFATMRIPLLKGRVFDDRDDVNPAAVVLIDETAARKFWPGQDAVGKRIKLGANPEQQPWLTIIGVVGSIRHAGLDAEPRPHVYRTYSLNPMYAPILVIRTAADPSLLINTLAAKIRSVNQAIPTYNVFSIRELVDRSTAQRRFVMMLLAGFAAAALLLALVGIYGTVSQSVIQRTHEIGLRMALGASPHDARGLILREGGRLIVAGLAVGALATIGLTRLMRSMLFEVQPLDPAVMLLAALTLGLFALLACYGPARRATRVDPIIALRCD